jgi:hypothetical protein
MRLTKSKFFILLMLIASIINMTSRSSHRNIDKSKTKAKNSSVSAKMNSAHNKKHKMANTKAVFSAKNSSKLGSIEIKKATDSDIIKLKSITRKDAKLSTIPALDFSRFALNTQISNLTNNVTQYNDKDFSTGIVKDTYFGDMYIITERYKLNIIQDIKIGTPIKYVKTILGNPSFNNTSFIVYKTKQYYLGFKGNEKIEQAMVIKKPKPYNPEILKTILLALNKGIYPTDDKVISNFIDVTHFI